MLEIGHGWRWALTASSLVCVVAWVVSAWLSISYGFSDSWTSIGIGHGYAGLMSVLEEPVRHIEGLAVFRSDEPYLKWQPEFGWNDVLIRIVIPLWMPTLMTAIPSVLLWRAHLRRRRLADACPACGYSLAGLAAGAACPECGASPKG